MKTSKINKFTGFTIALLLAGQQTDALGEKETDREYPIKAAFLYDFIEFTDWPKEKVTDPNASLTISITGKVPFQNTFDSLYKKKEAKDRKAVIRRFADR